jgi:hypothetical protein
VRVLCTRLRGVSDVDASIWKTPPRLATYQRAGSVDYFYDSLVNLVPKLVIFTMIDTDKALVPKSATETEGSFLYGSLLFW